MAVVPVLRLCLLLLNLYGTFKATKPPHMSQRSNRNGQGPSVRAMQLRKREMKSRLAVWVVWAIFAILERPLDNTIGFFTPFYNEFKCTVLIFLIISRSHGAEAIFLHFIHPLVRPYVPAVDNMLATLQSIAELVTLILFIPVEYMLRWWPPWRSSDDSEMEEKEEDRRRLRPRNTLRQSKMSETDRQAQVILQEIEDARDRVRTRTRSHLAVQNERAQPIYETRNTDPNAVGLRTRKRVLDHLNGVREGVKEMPGSRSTGIHHLDPTATTQLARGPAPHVLFPETPATHPIRMPTPSSSSQSSHEIWYPPQSVLEAHKRKSSSPHTTHRTPSPIYPPLPSAYPFTPRRSDPRSLPPRVTTPPGLVAPTPRRVSTGGIPHGTVDAYEGIDQFPGRASQAGTLVTERLAAPSLHARSRTVSEDFFHQALEPSVQMDVDMETLSTRDDSSADEESMGGKEEINPGLRDMADASARVAERKNGSKGEPFPGITRGRDKTTTPAGPLRRSARMRRDRSSSVETDEFGFTIRPDLIAINSLTADSTSVSSFGSMATGQSRKRPLARTRSALMSTQEEAPHFDSSDEESAKKKRKLRPGIDGQTRASAKNRHQLDAARLGGVAKPKVGDARKKVTALGKTRSDSPERVLKDRQVETRATRTRQPLSAQSRPNVTQRDRRK